MADEEEQPSEPLEHAPVPGQDHRLIPGPRGGMLKPPWEPGKSANPGGRPKGASILAPLLRKLAANPNEHGEGRLAESMADDLIDGASALARGVDKDTKIDVAPILRVLEKTDPDAKSGRLTLTGNGSIEWGEEPDDPPSEVTP